MKRFFLGLLTALSLTGKAGAAPTAPSLPPTKAPRAIHFEVRSFTLANGMEFVVVPRPGTATVACHLHVKAGTAQDPRGRSGLAHLLEHLMFKGTQRTGTTSFQAEQPYLASLERLGGALAEERARTSAGGASPDTLRCAALEQEIKSTEAAQRSYCIPEEFSRLYARAGASNLNAITTEDGTHYFVDLPSGRLALWGLLESDRLKAPVFRDFYTERQVVAEERRLTVDNLPDARLYEALETTAYVQGPYHAPVLGWPHDLNSIRRDEVQAFFERYYVPNNMVAVLVGDVDEARVRTLANTWFAGLVRKPLPPEEGTPEPPGEGQKRVHLEGSGEPELLVAWPGPPLLDAQEAALDVLADYLGHEHSGALYKELVVRSRLADRVQCVQMTRRLGNLFVLNVRPRHPHGWAEAEAALWREIVKLQQHPMDPAVLERVCTRMEADWMRGLESNAELASQLATAVAWTGRHETFDPRARWRAVTPRAIMLAAQQVLTRRNSTVATLGRASAPPSGPAPQPTPHPEKQSKEAKVHP